MPRGWCGSTLPHVLGAQWGCRRSWTPLLRLPATSTTVTPIWHSRRTFFLERASKAAIEQGVPPRGIVPMVSVTPAAAPDTATTSTATVDTDATRQSHETRSKNKEGGVAVAASPAPSLLPPFPVDEIEFNTRAPNGGHDERLAHERALRANATAAADATDGSDAGETNEHGTADGDASVQKTAVPLSMQSPDVQAAVAAKAATPEGQQALKAGGWVCAHCLSLLPYRSRSICTTCHTLRHDMESTVWSWRANPQNWLCRGCGEFNFNRDEACRCCASPRATSEVTTARQPIRRVRVSDEIQSAPVGSVINTRNRIVRWKCLTCQEVNSLQSTSCRHCDRERFELTLSCPQCAAPKQLNNAMVYGNEAGDAIHVTQPFGMHNCLGRFSPTMCCDRCQSSLHGAMVPGLHRSPWWCACGLMNQPIRQCCLRCRLPRSIASPAVLRHLLHDPHGHWDFVGSTNWLCESCDCVNVASHYLVTQNRAGRLLGRTTDINESSTSSTAAGFDGSRRKVARLAHGESLCAQCQQPWHHQVLRGGDRWRCSCHMVNHKDAHLCVSCGLPALDNVSADTLSLWTKGDWLCEKCLALNYRNRVRCTCGAQREA